MSVSFVVVAFVVVFYPEAFSLKPLHFLTVSGDPVRWCVSASPLFLWGFISTLFFCVKNRKNEQLAEFSKNDLMEGMVDSVYSGICEEVIYRWLFLLSGVILIKFANSLFFGWIGFGCIQWFFAHFFLPFFNFFTFGILSSVFLHSAGWFVGAAVLVSSALFAEGHRYMGLFGYLNGWFGGLYFFWILFSFGLPIVILVHFLYDAMVYLLIYFYSSVRK